MSDKPLEEMDLAELLDEYKGVKDRYDKMAAVASDLTRSQGDTITIGQKANERETRRMLMDETKGRLSKLTKLLKGKTF